MENKVNNAIDYSSTPKVLEVKNLRINFSSDSGMVYAVRGVSFDLYKGETLCIVGESGSGKSVTSKTIMGILANNAIVESGQILYEGEDLVRVSEEEFHRIRGHKIGMIFQDPLSSLNPICRVGKQITLISKELVAYRNAEANKEYEIHLIDNELSKVEGYFATLNAKVKSKASEAELSALEDEKEKIVDFCFLFKKDLGKNLQDLNNELDSLKAITEFNDRYLEKEINEKLIKINEEKIAFFNEYSEKFKSEDLTTLLNLRKEYLLL